MKLISLELESKLRDMGLWPQSWIAWAALYALGLDLLLFATQRLTRHASPSFSDSLTGWVIFLSVLAIVLLAIAASRWLRSQLLWRLRNRLIVTYVFIGVIPVFLLVVISLITLYLLAGQFASFVVTSDIATHLRSMESANRTIAHHLAIQIANGAKLDEETLIRARPRRTEWARRQVCARYGKEPQIYCVGPEKATASAFPPFIVSDFGDIVRDHGTLYLRTATVIAPEPASASTPSLTLRVLMSEPLDKNFVEMIAGDLGRIAVYGATGPTSSSNPVPRASESKPFLTFENGAQREQTFSAGMIPPASGTFDHEVTFPIPLQVVDWATGERQRAGALAEVETRPSVLYARLFAALGDYARGVEYILLSIAIVFALIEVFALFVGTKLTRSITSAVGQLYEATKHVNRADFSHRITVQSSDQLATLANSFNSMTTSIEKLVQEQKEKQRLEGELAIAQEVQAQLYPKLITQLETLEVHGFCLPARTVSGDYYDFLALNSERLMLAVGDISGKGISAALLMATIYSAVRAYSIEDLPILRELITQEPATVRALAGSGLLLDSEPRTTEVSPATLLALLNHQLYEGTPAAKYATLFLATYDGATRSLTYANGGHLPPILIAKDGSFQLLSCGGTVVGLFDNLSFPEATVQLRPGDLLVAYSDGVTEPENDYGEFGEERLIQLVRENRNLPLERITEIVTAAVLDWIGDNEQPDDVTLVLARAR
ncbi:MAG TPA: SpoIIE family protein phosphatase [Terriglobales bacterium]|jgi:sigma-B regulation protein RsbU (phosphoserine phosphatase)|nr:SpoIIE family protein phosphatase [Terriglobales bacterium]